MIDHSKAFQFQTNELGEIMEEIQNEMTAVICEAEHCWRKALHRVVVSYETPHDSTCDLCSSCYRAYTMGTVHGRTHEALAWGSERPISGDPQAPPRRGPSIRPVLPAISRQPPPVRLASPEERMS